MTGRILHISDLHVGRTSDSQPLEAMRALGPDLDPEIVVVTGDLTHRGRRAELEHARDVLLSLGPPVLAVPGNHDLPYSLPARLTRPRGEWNRVLGTAEPMYTSDRLTVVGLNSARPWRHEGGALEPSQLERAARKLAQAPAGSFRVAALHHHLAAPPWRAGHKRPVRRRDSVLQRLATAGVELVLSGHVHQSSVAERQEFEAIDAEDSSRLVLATSAGFGRPRPRRRGEALGFNHYDFDAETITAVTWSWTATGFSEVGRRTFRRGTPIRESQPSDVGH